MDPPLSIDEVTIPGPILASILQRFASCSGDSDGLLFGHVVPLPPPDLMDDEAPSTSTSGPRPSRATITGHFCSGSPLSFYDTRGAVILPTLSQFAARCADPGGPRLLGWISGRRRTGLRPSMRERAVSLSLVKTLAKSPPAIPCIFLLLTSSVTEDHIHTHEYRVFVSISRGRKLEERSLNINNLGMVLHGKYSMLPPVSAFPLVKSGVDLEGSEEGADIHVQRRAAGGQELLDRMVEGFGIGHLNEMTAPVVEHTARLEGMYGKMLLKLQRLARQVEESTARVQAQENHNLMLRSKLAGLELEKD